MFLATIDTSQTRNRDQIRLEKSPEAKTFEHRIMIPKPVYPRNVSIKRTKYGENQSLVGVQVSCIKDEVRANSNQSQDDDECGMKNDPGLVKDAMMPMPEKNGDECDLMNSVYPSLNVENLDDFLSNDNSELLTYFESCFKRKEHGNDCESKPKRKARKRKVAKHKSKQKIAKRLRRDSM